MESYRDFYAKVNKEVKEEIGRELMNVPCSVQDSSSKEEKKVNIEFPLTDNVKQSGEDIRKVKRIFEKISPEFGYKLHFTNISGTFFDTSEEDD